MSSVIDWLLKPRRNLRVQEIPSSLCVRCKGRLMLCGKRTCPLLVRSMPLAEIADRIPSELLDGSSPPGVFVGRIGYPKVLVGPLASWEKGSIEFMDLPEEWYNMNYRQIAEIRVRLLRGTRPLSVDSARNPPSYLMKLHDMLLSSRSSDVELGFLKPPKATVLLVDEAPPLGPSGPLKSLRVAPPPASLAAEKAYYDRDMKSEDAVIYLYERGFRVSEIQKLFSAGMLGVGKNRKLVPTRWSITAVDDIISRSLVEKIRVYPTIDEYRVYVERHMGNLFVVVLAPFRWTYEWIEAWYPGTTWNISGSKPEVLGDWEGYGGRTSYAEEIGGCYYAARLAVAERLEAEKRQAAVAAFREIYKDALFPVGVWLVRESLRRALGKKPRVFDDARSAFEYAFSQLALPKEVWLSKSRVARLLLKQEKLLEELE